ncbi:MAG: adenylosuccinate lyase [Nanoarchaeota archaeon]
MEVISPIDGRYRKYTEPLAKIFSEQGLIKRRIKVEGEYLIALSEHLQIGTREFSESEKELIRNLSNLSLGDAQVVKDIETKGYNGIKATNHDVKAVEYFMKHKLRGSTLEDSLEWIHFALTSEDVNNLAYGLMLSDGLDQVMLPVAKELYNSLEELAQKYKGVPMLARTHGQPASPTTFGKEFKVFSSRVRRQIEKIDNFKLLVKLNGATGNYNAHYVSYPNIDWIQFTKDFIEKINPNRKRLVPNLITTQIEPNDNYSELFDNFARFNTILIGFNQDMWRYISDDWITQKPVEGEVGSSTMPHKINPIDFENGEGNLGFANAMFGFFSKKLPISRLQRDLSGSTVMRNIGSAFGYSLIDYKSTLKGLGKIAVNERKVIEELENHPEVISEAIQTVLRREGVEMSYEQLKEMTRGRRVTMEDFGIFINGLNIREEIKNELRQITPTNYTGIAKLLVEQNI